MDYRNADGSVAEMCGNGARVFVRYLLDHGLVELAGLSIATRAGVVAVSGPGEGEPDSWITVALGPADWLDAAPVVVAPGVTGPRPGVAVSMPNPHVVVFVDESELDALDLTRPPSVEPPLPHGQNVEFVVRGAGRLRMRVHERGVGETRSCGTGIAAATVAAAGVRPADLEGEPTGGVTRPVGGDGRPWRIEVPGGVCAARWQPDGHVLLSGPAVVVARVVLEADWIAAALG
jgi:diaminopimelate epimerase